MQPARGESDQHIAGANVFWIGSFRALDQADREAREIVFARLVDIGKLRRLAAHQTDTCKRASASDTFDDFDGDTALQLAGPNVIEEKKRLCTMTDNVVNAHRNAVDADAIVTAER